MNNARIIFTLFSIRPGIALFFMLWCCSAAVSAGTLYYVHTDHLGTPRVITDANQQKVWEGDRLPFGETDISSNQIEYNLRFPGQYYDSESGLHYNYFRDYDPSLGRYVQSDPIGLEGGLNTYGYVGGNSINFIDPDGLKPCVPGTVSSGSCHIDDGTSPSGYPNEGKCATAECAAGILPNPTYPPDTQCKLECNFKYQPICTGAGAAVGYANKLGGAAVGGTCVLVKLFVCDMVCDDDENSCPAP